VTHQVVRKNRFPLIPILLVTCSGLAISACGTGLKLPTFDSTSSAKKSNTDKGLRDHIYAGIGLGVSRLAPDTDDTATYEVGDGSSTGAQITLGKDLSPLISVEGHLTSLGSAELSFGGDIDYNTAGISALLYAGGNRHNYKRNGFTGFGRLTLAILNNSADDHIPYEQNNAVHPGIGAGLEYMTASGLGVRGEVISYATDALYSQLGLIYRFGSPQTEPEVEDRCHNLTGILEGVNFRINSADLTDAALSVLDGIAQILAECINVPIHITAHTDNTGSDEYNIDLSQRRADSVIKHLISNGIDQSRITSEVFGESMPIDTNDTEAGRSRNRRVELKTR